MRSAGFSFRTISSSACRASPAPARPGCWDEIVRLAGDRPVFGLAPSSAAARVLEVGIGIGTTTLQWLLARYGAIAEGTATEAELRRAREQFAGAVMVVDESSMIGTVQMQSLMRIADALNLGRLVLVGDTMQLKSVEAGQPFRLLQRAGNGDRADG